MDNTLGALVEQYKAEPSPKLRRMIWNSILSEELAEVLKNISITPESDWFVFDDTIQAKRIVDRKYLVVEVFVRGDAMPRASFKGLRRIVRATQRRIREENSTRLWQLQWLARLRMQRPHSQRCQEMTFVYGSTV